MRPQLIQEAARMRKLAGIIIEEQESPELSREEQREQVYQTIEKHIKDGKFYIDEENDDLVVGHATFQLARFHLTHILTGELDYFRSKNQF
jgi:hypothetical protein